MNRVAFILVCITLFSHAYLNYLIKRSTNKHICIAVSKIVEVAILSIPAIFLIAATDFREGFALRMSIACVFGLVHNYFLSRAYDQGKLSVVYPLSQSAALFLPVLSYFIIGEVINGIGWASIALITVGTIVMHFESFDKAGMRALLRNLNGPGTIYALIAAFCIAGNTVGHKVSVDQSKPFSYSFLYTTVMAISYFSFCIFHFSVQEVRNEWALNKRNIILVGVLNCATAMLIIFSLSVSKAAFVGSLRQLSVVVSLIFASVLLNEKITAPKVVGVLISLTGSCLLLAAD